MNYWKLMPGRSAVYAKDFVAENVIRIGFLSDASVIGGTQDAVTEKVAKERPEATKRQITTWANQLHKFLNEIAVGDRVLIFDPGTRLYHIGEVTTEVVFDEKHDLPYTRSISWVGTVSRDELPTTSRYALGAILTLFSVNDEVQKDIETVLSGEKVTVVDELEEDVIDTEGEEVLEKAIEYMKDKIQRLDWEEMQELVAGLLRAMGYRTTVSPAGADRGKDIVASPDGLGLEDPRIHVEVKHRKGTMGAPEVRAFVGGLRKVKGLYVSTGGFTREAQYEAERSEVSITLVNIDEFARMVIQYYDTFDPEARAILPLKKIYWPL